MTGVSAGYSSAAGVPFLRQGKKDPALRLNLHRKSRRGAGGTVKPFGRSGATNGKNEERFFGRKRRGLRMTSECE